MNNIEKCIDEVVNATLRDMETITEVIADKYNIPIKDRYKIRLGVIADFVKYGKKAIEIANIIE